MSSHKILDQRAMGIMIVVCMIWGMQQVGLKASADDVSPTLQIALRSGIAAGLVSMLILWRGTRLSLRDGRWKPGIAVGLLFSLEYVLVAEGLRHTSASHMAVFLYSAPIFAALGLHRRLPEERLQRLQWVGVALAFCGIVVAFLGGGTSTAAAANMLWGDFLGLLAGAAWGATTVTIRTSTLAAAPATHTLLYQLLVACVVLLSTALFLGQMQFDFTPLALGNLAFQSLIVSFASFLTWFWLLRRYLASQLGVFTFLTPLFGVVFGIWLLNESVDAYFLAGAVLVLLGITLVNGHTGVRRLLQAGRRSRVLQSATVLPLAGGESRVCEPVVACTSSSSNCH
ncbi:DMT family transporter [Granulosicoccus sp. 3-233]|uniref:DMT family transporter n=1 Tax=Granulosicoccus sp. 3-233 TaxID=3417969 RepID=UPI003D329E80